MMLSGWGNYPRLNSEWVVPRDTADFARTIATTEPTIARGAGRSYGDAAVGTGVTLSTSRLARVISFDPQTGSLKAEAGVTLDRVIDLVLPHGFFPPVVPGTRYVTLGGMIASNVHGKNHHHAGSFGRHVRCLTLLGPDGRPYECSPRQNPELFRATIGGMGLTGIILDVTFDLLPVETSFVRQETIVTPDLDSVISQFDTSNDWQYSVAWIDPLARGSALGRSVFLRGGHAKLDDLSEKDRAAPLQPLGGARVPIPFNLPNFTINRLSARCFNELYYFNGRRNEGIRSIKARPYFFPLDGVRNFGRVYGRQGFVQHQCVIPQSSSRAAIAEILELVSRGTNASFVAVLKLFGSDDSGLMSFPLKGLTLALDFPANPKSLSLLKELDKVVLKSGGRIYFAKDACQDPTLVEAGYANLSAFRQLRAETGASKRFQSHLSQRLGL